MYKARQVAKIKLVKDSTLCNYKRTIDIETAFMRSAVLDEVESQTGSIYGEQSASIMKYRAANLLVS
jgi:hypothetical protein